MTELRRFLRAQKEYLVEYGVFPLTDRDDELKKSYIKNIGAGGLLFTSQDSYEPGQQLVLKIHITGWRHEGKDIVEGETDDAVAKVAAIAIVKRCDYNPEDRNWLIGVQFVGRILK